MMPITDSRSARRRYQSPLREQQTAQTRDRILAGLAQTMAEGIDAVSVPAVAKAAGVSVATVYRHFPTKRALFEALPDHFARQVGMDRPTVPRSMQELEALIRQLFAMYERLGDVARAAMESELGHEARRAQMPKRLGDLRQVVANVAPELSIEARERVVRLVLVLTASGAQRMLGLAGQRPREAAEDVIWAVRALIGAERSRIEEDATG